MRVIDQNYNTITEYDLTCGKLVDMVVIKEDAVPIDDITKFVWADDDYEEVQMYVPDSAQSVEEQIAQLKGQLQATDYQIIKCYEYQLLNIELPYDIEALHEERQAIRDQINALEIELLSYEE